MSSCSPSASSSRRLAAELAGRGLRTVAFEAHEMTVERHAELAARAGGVTLIPFGRKIEELRTVKDPSEIELLRDRLPDHLPGHRRHAAR